MFSRPTRDYPTVPSTSANGLSRKSNQRYTTARTRLAVAEAGYEAVQDASPDGIPEVLNSPLITHLRQRQAELERQFSQMSERFAPEWPPLIQEASQAGWHRVRGAQEELNRADLAYDAYVKALELDPGEPYARRRVAALVGTDH